MVIAATKQDRRDLIEFLDKIRSILKLIVDARDLLFRETLRNDFKAAYNDDRVDLWANCRPVVH